MNSYAFFTDSDSDLPFRFVDELELNMVYMPYMVDGKEYFDDLGRNGKEKEFFDAMRGGAAPVTSLLPTAAYEEYFEPVLASGRDILFAAFSSQLSGTIQNIYAAREELLQKKSVQEYRAAQANLARALSRLRVREHWKGTR